MVGRNAVLHAAAYSEWSALRPQPALVSRQQGDIERGSYARVSAKPIDCVWRRAHFFRARWIVCRNA